MKTINTPRTRKAQKECAKLGGDYQVWYGYMSAHAFQLEKELVILKQKLKNKKI